VDNGIQPTAVQPFHQLGRRDEIGQLPFAQVLPLSVLAENVGDGDIGAASLVKAGDDVRSDEAGAAGNE
jgi:hypothetical protein